MKTQGSLRNTGKHNFFLDGVLLPPAGDSIAGHDKRPGGKELHDPKAHFLKEWKKRLLNLEGKVLDATNFGGTCVK